MAPPSNASLVSVIIPTHNHADYVVAAVESALAQTYSPLEVVVVDDGSTDRTRDVLSPYLDRVRYVYQENQGLAAARNTGIQVGTGPYVALLDSDDLWLPDKLRLQMAFLQAHPEVALVAAHAALMDRDGRVPDGAPLYPDQQGETVSLERVVLDSPLTASTIVARREALPRPLPFTPGLRFREDWDMCMRIAAQHPIGYVPEVLAYKRVHDSNLSGSLVSQQHVDRRLEHGLRVISSVAPLLPGAPEWVQSLIARAEARELADAAGPSFVNGAFLAGAERLAAAIRLDPATWQGGPVLVDLLTHYANLLLQARGEEAALALLRATFHHLPPELDAPGRLRRAVYGRMYVAMAFRRYRAGQFRNVLPRLARGTWHDPRCLANRGVISILARSLIPAFRGAPVHGQACS